MDLSLAGASGTVPFGENISPTALKSGLMMGYSHVIGFDMFNSGPTSAWNVEMPPDGSWANPYPVDYQAASGVARNQTARSWIRPTRLTQSSTA